MPWSPDEAKWHTEKANTPHKQRTWAAVANSVLKETDDHERAIREANAAVERARDSVHQPMNDPLKRWP